MICPVNVKESIGVLQKIVREHFTIIVDKCNHYITPKLDTETCIHYCSVASAITTNLWSVSYWNRIVLTRHFISHIFYNSFSSASTARSPVLYWNSTVLKRYFISHKCYCSVTSALITNSLVSYWNSTVLKRHFISHNRYSSVAYMSTIKSPLLYWNNTVQKRHFIRHINYYISDQCVNHKKFSVVLKYHRAEEKFHQSHLLLFSGQCDNHSSVVSPVSYWNSTVLKRHFITDNRYSSVPVRQPQNVQCCIEIAPY